MKLDYSRPYAEVYGLPGVAFEQGGQYFNAIGIHAQPVIEAEEIPPPVDNEPLPYCTLIEQASEPVAPSTLDTMHWRHLKALVESYGGAYTNKEEALSFLKGTK